MPALSHAAFTVTYVPDAALLRQASHIPRDANVLIAAEATPNGEGAKVGTSGDYLNIVSRLFPGHGERVRHLADHDEQFQGLCEDYEFALETLAALERQNLPQDDERLCEYRALLNELERDLALVLGSGGA